MQTMQPSQFFVHPNQQQGLMQQQHTVAYMTPNGMVFQQPVRMVDIQQAQEQQYIMQLQQQFNQQLWAHHNPARIPSTMMSSSRQAAHQSSSKSTKGTSSRTVPASPSNHASTPRRNATKEYVEISPHSGAVSQDHNKVSPRSRSNAPFVIIPQSPSTLPTGLNTPEDYTSDSTGSSSSTLYPLSVPSTPSSHLSCADQDQKVVSDYEARTCMRRAKRRHECIQSLWFNMEDTGAHALYALRSDQVASLPRPLKRFSSSWSRDASEPIIQRIDKMLMTLRSEDVNIVQ